MTHIPDLTKRAPMDQMGKRILRTLADHVLVDVAAVAKDLGATPEMVQARLAAMREAGVLQGFEPRLDLARVERRYEFLVSGVPTRGMDGEAIARLSACADVTRVFSLASAHSVAFTLVGKDPAATRARGLAMAAQAGLGQVQAVLIINTFQDRPGAALVDALAGPRPPELVSVSHGAQAAGVAADLAGGLSDPVPA